MRIEDQKHVVNTYLYLPYLFGLALLKHVAAAQDVTVSIHVNNSRTFLKGHSTVCIKLCIL